MMKGWHGWLGTFTGVASITVAALPWAALAVWSLARRRSVTGVTPPWTWRLSLAEVGIVYGTVPWVWMILLPGDRAGSVSGRVSLVPLRDLVAILADRGLVTLIGQVVVNLLIFAALGFFAPLRFAALASVSRILALAAGCSILVETAQYVLRLDRVSSVDDVLLNAAGAGLAALASRRWWRATARSSSDKPRLATAPELASAGRQPGK
ncbi:VanZ family protein [Micromonospora sp. HM5-17]|uniref:VanZ family protein n=1 Tax=Micromonospora sp. HM5-17 TaxID=2487710 RepID=UPI000F4950C3|nr:VanZ family protein [Micromonospora sp. HM5-17]ROT32034.1 VanZ family protein [Micromonospora sp. HM5-17]